MGISGPGVGGTAQPPQMRESETNAFTENMKKNVLAMLPADTMEVIPFTQGSRDQVFNYRSEPDRPSLHGLLNLRGGVSKDEASEDWQQTYQSLLDNLPPDLKEMIEQEALKPLSERNAELSELNSLLVLIAKGKMWISSALLPIAPNSAAEREQILNMALPYVALRAVLGNAETVLLDIQKRLDTLGPNEPTHDNLTGIITDIKADLKELDTLRKALVKNGNASEIRQGMTDISADIARLSSQFKRNDPGNGNFLIIGNTLDALSLVSEAWAMEYGSQSLLISTNLASLGISTSESELGVFGKADNTILDSILDGLLTATPKGSGIQLEEMNDLYNSLAEMRDS